MSVQESAKFRATTGPIEAFGKTPQEALATLKRRIRPQVPPLRVCFVTLTYGAMR